MNIRRTRRIRFPNHWPADKLQVKPGAERDTYVVTTIEANQIVDRIRLIGNRFKPDKDDTSYVSLIQALGGVADRWAALKVKIVPWEDDEVAQILAETVHTAFRKGADGGGATEVWNAIHSMDAQQWDNAIAWMLYALDASGYQIVKKDDQE